MGVIEKPARRKVNGSGVVVAVAEGGGGAVAVEEVVADVVARVVGAVAATSGVRAGTTPRVSARAAPATTSGRRPRIAFPLVMGSAGRPRLTP
jgi:hypothetical protein